MKKIILSAIICLAFAFGVQAQHTKKDGTPDMRYKENKTIDVQPTIQNVNPSNEDVSGYTKDNGTSVSPYKRTKANDTNKDNYSTKPNTNPYTGSKGYVKPKKDEN